MSLRRNGKNGCLRPLFMLILILSVIALGFAVRHVLVFRDHYVMLTVEESSIGALLAWPPSGDQNPCAFVDCEESALHVSEPISLAGVSLCVYRNATSQGILFSDSISFSRLGRGRIDLDRDASVQMRNMEGLSIEALQNDARILRGNLVLRKTGSDGTLSLRYAGEDIVLKSGEHWEELLVSFPNGVRRVEAADWVQSLNEAMENGYPATRLALCNRGLWPKGKVEGGLWPW